MKKTRSNQKQYLRKLTKLIDLNNLVENVTPLEFAHVEKDSRNYQDSRN